MSVSPIPPRGSHFADPAAAAVFEAIKTLEPAAQHDLLDLLRTRLATAGFTGTTGPLVRIDRAVAALREAAEILGCSPSVAEFERLREKHPEFGWPPEATLRRTIGNGSWNVALGAAHLEPVAEGDALVVELGAEFTRAEALDAIGACTRDLAAIPSLGEYITWCRRPENARVYARIPRSQSPFDRLFGGWHEAISTFQQNRQSAGKTPLVRRRSSRRWTDAELIESLQDMAARLGRPPATTNLGHLRAQMIEELRAQGKEPLVPTYPSFRRLGTTWDDVLVAAGLAARGGRHNHSNPRRESRRRHADDSITHTLHSAYEAIGDPFTVKAFQAWRTAELTQRGPYARIPGYEVIQSRLGSWEEAQKIARQAP